ncbi:MAG: hypothetical protein AAF710_04435 [Planctomycetota bacterium]
MTPTRCVCTDWQIDDATPGVLALQPSAKTVTRSLGLSGVLLVFAGLVVLACGFPPGCRAVSAQRERLAEMEQRLERFERQARRSGVGVTANEPGSIGQRVAQQQREAAEQLRVEVEAQRQKAEAAQATLGTVGDTLYWSALGGLFVLAAAVPFVARRERVTLRRDADGHTLHVRRRGQVRRSGRLDLRRYNGLAVVVRRRVTRRGKTASYDDHGWAWSVLLVSRQPGVRWLEVVIDEDPFLPQPFGKLTSRVRQTLRYFESLAPLPTAPPLKIDVGEDAFGLIGRRLATRVEKSDRPASSATPYRPIN